MTTLGVLASNLFDPYGYSTSELSMICLELLMAGVVGAVFTGAFIDKTLKYKYTMIFLTFGVTCASTMVIVSKTWFLEYEGLFIGSLIFIGFLGTGYMPLAISYIAEVTFPLSPALVNGTLSLMSSAVAFLLSLLGTFLISEGKNDYILSPDNLIQV